MDQRLCISDSIWILTLSQTFLIFDARVMSISRFMRIRSIPRNSTYKYAIKIDTHWLEWKNKAIISIEMHQSVNNLSSAAYQTRGWLN